MTARKKNSMFSKPFREGIVTGFSGPLMFFASPKIQRSTRFNGSVSKAWSEVDKLLAHAAVEQGERVEQKAGRKRRKSKEAA